jgi:hypothetical protein
VLEIGTGSGYQAAGWVRGLAPGCALRLHLGDSSPRRGARAPRGTITRRWTDDHSRG